MYEFDKVDSKILKSIAVILMLAHHCFRNPQVLEEFHIISIIGIDNLSYFGEFCKICVPLFVFVSGYGLFLAFNKIYSNKNLLFKSIIKEVVIRYIKLMKDYWFVALISYFVMQILVAKTFECFFEHQSFLNGFFHIVMNFLGFEDMLGFSNEFNGAWWYMSFAIVLVAIAPCVTLMLRKSKFTRIILFSFIIVFPRLFLIRDNATTHYYQFLFAYVLGGYSAYSNLLGCIKAKWVAFNDSYLKKILMFCLLTFLLIIAYETREYLSYKYYFDIVWGIVPFVFIVYTYLYCFPYIYKIGEFISKYSTYIFLIHLFVKNDLLYTFIYSLHLPILIVVFLLTICILIGMLLDKLKYIIHYDLFIKKIIFAIDNF